MRDIIVPVACVSRREWRTNARFAYNPDAMRASTDETLDKVAFTTGALVGAS